MAKKPWEKEESDDKPVPGGSKKKGIKADMKKGAKKLGKPAFMKAMKKGAQKVLKKKPKKQG